jgi:predicted RNase H-like nuclease (RuvC/YqgF family)
VLLQDGSGGGAGTAELLAKKGVAAVIYGKELSHFAADKFFEFDIPAFSTAELPLLLNEGDFAFIDQHLLNEKIEEWRERKNFFAQGKPQILYRGYAI